MIFLLFLQTRDNQTSQVLRGSGKTTVLLEFNDPENFNFQRFQHRHTERRKSSKLQKLA